MIEIWLNIIEYEYTAPKNQQKVPKASQRIVFEEYVHIMKSMQM